MIFLIIFLNSISISNELKDNYTILDSISQLHSKQITEFLLSKDVKKLKLKINSPYNSVILESNLNIEFDRNNILNLEDGDTLNIKLIKYGVSYQLLNNDSLLRNIQVKSFIYNRTLENIFIDSISREDINLIENSKFDELKSTIPPKKESLYHKILEPVIVIGSVIITVVLLFTIRS